MRRPYVSESGAVTMGPERRHTCYSRRRLHNLKLLTKSETQLDSDKETYRSHEPERSRMNLRCTDLDPTFQPLLKDQTLHSDRQILCCTRMRLSRPVDVNVKLRNEYDGKEVVAELVLAMIVSQLAIPATIYRFHFGQFLGLSGSSALLLT